MLTGALQWCNKIMNMSKICTLAKTESAYKTKEDTERRRMNAGGSQFIRKSCIYEFREVRIKAAGM